MRVKAANDEVNAEMAERLAKIFGGMGILGLGARGVAAATAPSPSALSAVPPVRKIVVPIPVPAQEDEEQDQLPGVLRRPVAKLAEGVLDGVDAPLPLQGLHFNFPQSLEKYFPETAKAWNNRVPNYVALDGSDAKTVAEHPLFTPAAIGAAGAGGVGGWMLGSHLAAKHQRNSANKELDKAKQDYENQVLTGYKQSQVEAAIDRAYDAMEKMGDDFQHSAIARWLWPLNNFGAPGGAATATVMGLSGAIPAYAAYKYMRDTNTANAKQQAILDIEKDDAQQRDPVVLGKLVPTPKPGVNKPKLPAVMGG